MKLKFNSGQFYQLAKRLEDVTIDFDGLTHAKWKDQFLSEKPFKKASYSNTHGVWLVTQQIDGYTSLVGLSKRSGPIPVLFADMAIIFFWRYRQRGGKFPPTDLDLNFGLTLAQHNLRTCEPARKLLEEFEQLVLATHLVARRAPWDAAPEELALDEHEVCKTLETLYADVSTRKATLRKFKDDEFVPKSLRACLLDALVDVETNLKAVLNYRKNHEIPQVSARRAEEYERQLERESEERRTERLNKEFAQELQGRVREELDRQARAMGAPDYRNIFSPADVDEMLEHSRNKNNENDNPKTS